MNVSTTPLDGVLIIEPDRFEDDRGWFMELWNEERYQAAGVPVMFAQDNISHSRRGVLRGMHYQSPNEQGKLVTVLAGSIFDVAVDVREESPSFGRWYGCELSAVNRRQMWIPAGFAHGFLVTSAEALVHYNCTHLYDRDSERTLAWNDGDVAIVWPFPPVLVSERDSSAPSLHELRRAGLLPRHTRHSSRFG